MYIYVYKVMVQNEGEEGGREGKKTLICSGFGHVFLLLFRGLGDLRPGGHFLGFHPNQIKSTLFGRSQHACSNDAKMEELGWVYGHALIGIRFQGSKPDHSKKIIVPFSCHYATKNNKR